MCAIMHSAESNNRFYLTLQMWPIAQRCVTDLIHWCLLPDGRVLIHSRSEVLEDKMTSEERSLMRATMHFNFLLLEAKDDSGCLLTNYLKVSGRYR